MSPLSGKESTCQCRRRVSIHGWGRPPGEGNGSPLQSSCLGNPINRGARWVPVPQVIRVGHDLVTRRQLGGI